MINYIFKVIPKKIGNRQGFRVVKREKTSGKIIENFGDFETLEQAEYQMKTIIDKALTKEVK